ncbi:MULTISPECIES: TetR/AcrR family transcriptional regulator [Kitasatospora]|uniref:Putative TetR family transcriptional regulator n=1 Tax=Kitasatospora setae (strain ATCC 33774 / DSM 43861 / JCM 3304 / KCC A-0304 / NBRC 14216 / KM-6054) TaxID=452652 RepID=E4NDP7_KITSK|nr:MULTISPECIES: TetR/AcrR family transcriptional regulator [Kitasatospora]BAJ29328.1 putative TetR family transcriptional regulator [Kitasatospora setae KM-6054]
MGNREDLLASAARCLQEKGYGRTTARDIASGAGVSLAAIGYHYGSKDALLVEALVQAMGEWGEVIGAALSAAADVDDPRERFVRAWDAVRDSFTTHRGLWTVQFELLGQFAHLPGLPERLAGAQKAGRLGLAALFQGRAEEEDTPDELARGIFYQSLLLGQAAQWLIDPAIAPGGEEFLRGLALVSGDVLTG